jgi:ubiquinone/menaquinone biosynthesis C-methylase UbiE
MSRTYVHGYEEKESIRLNDQAQTLAELLHCDSIFPAGSKVLEAGCGVGAQTVTLAAKNPQSLFTSIDISGESVNQTRARCEKLTLKNVTFQQADIFKLPFGAESFDHVFVCFVLEHLKNPVEALAILKNLIKPSGTITVIEGDHGSAYFHPDSEYAHKAISCQVELQRRAGGNAMMGRELYPLLNKAGFESIHVSPRMVYADASQPELVEGFTKKTFTAMIEGIREKALAAGLMKAFDFDRGIEDLYTTAGKGGVFCYTFFKAVAVK